MLPMIGIIYTQAAGFLIHNYTQQKLSKPGELLAMVVISVAVAVVNYEVDYDKLTRACTNGKAGWNIETWSEKEAAE